MRNASIRLLFVLIGGLLVAGSARADYMNWSYHWSIGPTPVLSSGTGTVSQALGQPGKGASRILAAAVTTSSSASAKNPDHYSKMFSLTLHLTDWATHKSGSLTFAGLIRGTLTATSSHLTETFLNPNEYLKLGNHVYWVELPRSLTLMPPGSLVVPTYYAQVREWNIAPPPRPMTASVMIASIAADPSPAASTPEPSSLALGGLGVVLLGCFALWRIWG